MKTIQIWVKSKLKVIKRIFILSVIVAVIAELVSLGKVISFQQLQSIFQDIPYWKAIIMLIVGLLAVTPMLNYDNILTKLLEQRPKKRDLIKNSWMINTINNMVGFGGAISVGLRSEIFGKNGNQKKVMQSISKIFLFTMAGISIYSLIALCLVALDLVTPFVAHYWIWLVGGALYFPIVLITTYLKNEFTGNMTRKIKIELILTSFIDWTCVIGSFLLIGYLIGVQINFLEIIPIFIVAIIIGIISMIPGAAGSFDIVMILGITALGVDKEVVVAWILLYRLFYYMIPFIIGVLFSAKNASNILNTRYSNIPREISANFAHRIVVFLMYFSGVMMILSATIPVAFSDFKLLNILDPLSFHIILQFPSVLLGFLLIIMGRGFAARVTKSYWPTICLISLTLIYTLLRDFTWSIILFLIVLLLIILFSKAELYRKQLVYSWEKKTIDGIIFTSLSMLYVGIGVYNLPSFPHHRGYNAHLFFPSERIWISGFLAILVVSLCMFFFIRYLQRPRHQIGQNLDEQRAMSVLENYGGNMDSHLLFLKDKRMFVYTNSEGIDTVLFQFKAYNDKCTVMGDPSGKRADFPAAIEAFLEECDIWGYSPVFYEVSQEIVMILHEYGYDFIKMGEEAHVELDMFSLVGKKNKGKRTIKNRFEKENYAFEVVSPPFDSHFVETLREISDEWLGSRKEKGFSLGFFTEDYIQRSPIGIVKEENGNIIAFANLIPTYNDPEGTIDLMRHKKDAPSGVMDYLFLSLFEYMKEDGKTYFNLGMAPLSNVGSSKKSFVQERIAFLVYNFGTRFYSFQGLRNYKNKYATSWKPRYTLYSRKNSIIYVILTLLIIDNMSVDREK
ncbi:bifunctional lysylphosphatidylglycerol flippase/synthetase MprF [Listeria booriae]|uniref:bifunctional lysylphosphatidylglycerol flippase/synthetase MprF n=1 Tax=Listeria booriae TaxID=1552123 RepID=UPI001627AF55|nr:bifunctional lysylphosphatidylglycerol flippase/synthetase MprF [Listeria booriae]MBC2368211.1 bifunctional lysylphosphatidylglycerol flippase/synthetase MprF [Listeria booriae]